MVVTKPDISSIFDGSIIPKSPINMMAQDSLVASDRSSPIPTKILSAQNQNTSDSIINKPIGFLPINGLFNYVF